MMAVSCYDAESKLYNARYIPETVRNKFYLQLDLRNHEKAPEIEREMRLVEASIDGHFEVIKDLLESGVSVDAEELNRALFYASKNYLTPLQIAAALGHVDCANILIHNQANVNARDRYDVTALHLAAQEGHFLCLKALLQAGADYNPATKYSKSSYYTAIPYLGGTTPLHLAAANDHVDCASELMQHGADYNSIDEKGRTALYIAAQSGFSECVLAQIQCAISYDILSLPGFDSGDTPLHFAVRRGMTECVKKLLLLGSDVNHMNYAGSTPLHYAVSSGICDVERSFEILKLLVLHGYNCDVNRKDSLDVAPLQYVSFGTGSLFRRRPDMASFLIARGADINIRNNRGVTLLEYEYNSSTDPSVLFAIIQSLNVLPRVRNLRDFHYNSSFCGLVGNITPLYAMWLAISREVDYDPDYDHDPELLPSHPSVQIKRKWYNSLLSNPRSLTHSCRYAIRKAMGPKRFRRIEELPLPEAFLSYLLFENEALPY